MTYQVYINKETDKIIVHKKSYSFDVNKNIGFELIEEIDGESWEECNKKITEKYFSSEVSDIYD